MEFQRAEQLHGEGVRPTYAASWPTSGDRYTRRITSQRMIRRSTQPSPASTHWPFLVLIRLSRHLFHRRPSCCRSRLACCSTPTPTPSSSLRHLRITRYSGRRFVATPRRLLGHVIAGGVVIFRDPPSNGIPYVQAPVFRCVGVRRRGWMGCDSM